MQSLLGWGLPFIHNGSPRGPQALSLTGVRPDRTHTGNPRGGSPKPIDPPPQFSPGSAVLACTKYSC